MKNFAPRPKNMQSFFIACFLETLPHMALMSLQVHLLTYLLTYLLACLLAYLLPYLFIYLFFQLFIYLLIYCTQNNCLLIFFEAPHPRPVFAHASGQGVTSRHR